MRLKHDDLLLLLPFFGGWGEGRWGWDCVVVVVVAAAAAAQFTPVAVLSTEEGVCSLQIEIDASTINSVLF